MDGKVFSGIRGGDPTKAKYWLEGVEKILEQIECFDHEKLGCGVLLFTGEANQWWNTTKQGIILDHLTWEFFLVTFRNKFLGKQYVEAHKQELITLKQDELSVAELISLQQGEL